KRFLRSNVVGLALLAASVSLISVMQLPPQFTTGPPQYHPRIIGPTKTLWGRISEMRNASIADNQASHSLIDASVTFSSMADEVESLPRAAEIGFFAPFPNLWFKPGLATGRVGRVLAGGEMLGTWLLYLGVFLEFLTALRARPFHRHLDLGLTFLTATIGIVSLGMVVTSVGILYRLRFAFWLLLAT